MQPFEELKSWFLSVTPGDFPPAPFELLPYVTIIDTAKWIAKVREDLNLTYSPRSKYGALHKELQDAYLICNSENIKKTQKAQSLESLILEPDELF